MTSERLIGTSEMPSVLSAREGLLSKSRSPLTPEREAELLKIAHHCPVLSIRKDAEEELIFSNAALVVGWVRQVFRGRVCREPTDDDYQNAVVGFLLAIRKYDATSGNRLAAYAKYHVLNEVWFKPNRERVDRPTDARVLGHYVQAVDSTVGRSSEVMDAKEEASRALGRLRGHDREIMQNIYGIRCPELGRLGTARKFGVTHQRVHQIEMRAATAMGGELRREAQTRHTDVNAEMLQAVELRFNPDGSVARTYDEIAEQMGISRSAVIRRLARAKK